MIMKSLFISIVGRDKPGLLAEISSMIADLGGNIEEIRGHTIFAEKGKKIANISMIISGEDIGTLYQRLREKLKPLAEEFNLKIQIYPIDHLIGEEKEEIGPEEE